MSDFKPTSKVKIVYHNQDLDGWCSGSIAKMAMMAKGVDEQSIEMIGWNYGDPVPHIDPFDFFILVDICFPREDMQLLQSLGSNIWIDHHKSSIEDSRMYGYMGINGERKVGDSASLLAWKYFFPKIPVPYLVYWVDRYDVWKKTNEHGKDDWDLVLAYQYGMKAIMSEPNYPAAYKQWSAGFENMNIHIIEKGGTILNFIRLQNDIYAKRAFDLHFECLNFCAINQGEVNSEVVKSAVREDHDGILTFRYNGKDWTVSLYGNELCRNPKDLSKIAVKYGGGGHANACGFSVKNINEVLNWDALNCDPS